jgi:hypothetical protein
MNGNGNAFTPAGHSEDMVTTVNSSKIPPLLGQQGGKSLTGNLLHKANSSTSEPAESSPSSWEASSQPMAASLRCSSNSSWVSPWLTQPGKAGTSPQKPPSSAGRTIALKTIPKGCSGNSQKSNSGLLDFASALLDNASVFEIREAFRLESVQMISLGVPPFCHCKPLWAWQSRWVVASAALCFRWIAASLTLLAMTRRRVQKEGKT